MTALNAAIIFNNSTGSDTTASGSSAGANVYGSGASTTSASAVVSGITTTGVQAGDLLWVQSSSGRQFSVIASVDSATQVTCDDTFANTESSRTWAIGGKRATLLQNADSRRLFESDTAAGMIFEFASGHVETNVPAVNTSTSGTTSAPIIMRAEAGYTTRPKFSGSSSAGGVWFDINNNHWHFDGLEFTAPSGVSGVVYVCALRLISSANDCVFDASNAYSYAVYSLKTMFSSCTFKGATSAVLSGWQNKQVRMSDCIIQDSSNGFAMGAGAGYVIENCIFQNITNNAVYRSGSSDEFRNYTIKNCIFKSCGTAFSHTGTLTQSIYASSVSGCIFSENTTGVEFSTMDEDSKNLFRFENNAFYGNTTDISGVTHLNKITLTADPFVDASASPPDFNLNADAGGGATLRANNYSINTDTAVYPFRQYVSDDFGGGGGAVLHPLASALHPLGE